MIFKIPVQVNRGGAKIICCAICAAKSYLLYKYY